MFSKMMIFVFCGATLCGCQSDYDRTVEDIKTRQFQSEMAKLNSVSTAEMETSEARGTKTCHVKQYTSAHLAKKRIDPATQKVSSYGTDMSDVFVRIYKDGSAGIAVTEDTYPGTNAYFLIEGKRYVADGDNYASLDRKAIDALKKDPVIKFSWTNWPYRNEVDKDDVIAGFSKSYQQCVDFLNGKS
ncbi:hypothetical protein GGQ73_000630 [Rhizobium skierniewicense]|uniref:Lipoprotein n=1 Tax=Rhizobium skierniewicense TaxID=984260 RepID=A0A7W6G0H8_9HYPH|nr:hypothetical protein [Rhizobium skierniewicense]MBB3944705.1 hypothetical protein [Rhizobium skierniewicense]